MAEPTHGSWNEGRLGRVLDRLPEAVLVLDEGLRLVHANAFARGVLGLELDQVVGESLWDLLPHLRDTDAPRQLQRALDTGEESRFVYHSTLTDRWLEMRAFPEGGALVVHTTDPSAAKAAEADLRRTQESLGLAMRGSRMGWWRRDLRMGLVEWSPELEEIFGLAAGSFDGTRQSFLDFVHPDERARLNAAVERAIASGEDYAIEFRFRRADGVEGWMEGRGKAVYEDGRPVASYGIGVDVTVRREAEDALREAESRQRFLVDLGQAAREIEGAEETMLLVAQMLGRHLGVTRCSYGLFEEDGDTCVIPGGLNDGVEPIVGAFRLSSFGPEMAARARLGLPTVVRDVRLEIGSPEAQAAYDAIQTRSYVLMPLVRGDRLVALMSVDHRDPRDWTPEEVELVRLVTERSWGYVERARAELALRRTGETFESLVRNSPFGIYVVDADFRLALVSQGAQKVFENVRPLVGRDFADVLRAIWEEPFASEAIAVFRRVLETGEPFHSPRTVESRFDTDDVESYDWRVERILMPDGRLTAVCHFYDLSERLRYEDALREANEGLEEAVRERTQDLTRANRDLDQFAYSVAHDLRAPLRSIVSTSRILLEDAGDRLTPEEADLLHRQAASGVRLAKIVDDLLGFARLADAQPRKGEFDLSALARRVAGEVAAQREGCAIEVQEGMRAVGDPSLIGYVLTNLLDNACKFSPQGGTVTVGEAGGAFFVRDQGLGFDIAHAGKLFVAFERLVGQEIEGTGVGLANVRRIVEKHGGRVWAQGEPGKGATFWFTLG